MSEIGFIDRIVGKFEKKAVPEIQVDKLLEKLGDTLGRATQNLIKHHGGVLAKVDLKTTLPRVARRSSVVALASFLLAMTAAPPSGMSLPTKSAGYTQAKLSSEQQVIGTHTALENYKSNPTLENEKALSETISQLTGVSSAAQLDGHRLNKILGLIGAEQHLYRYPGDTIEDQLQTKTDYDMYAASGIAPHTGAWGYFASSKLAMTPDLVEKEKYYFAVQTFLSPEFETNWPILRDWFKYRKMIAVNTKTGQAVVAVVADAGPAEWTGKSFGGSPEVMHHLGYGGGPRKGEIVILFVDDPAGKIPLGPVNLSTHSPDYLAGILK